MGALSDAIAADVLEHGSGTRTSSPAARVLTKNIETAGVALKGCTEVAAAIAVSNLHLKST